ncbi:MAG: hypothetical protein AAF519_17550 [Bacteroidota bacterium]
MYDWVIKAGIFRRVLSIVAILILLFLSAKGQTVKPEEIKAMVLRYQEDVRGPYKDIRWFCKDGSYRVPQERCPEPSPQRARYKDEVIFDHR